MAAAFMAATLHPACASRKPQQRPVSVSGFRPCASVAQPFIGYVICGQVLNHSRLPVMQTILATLTKPC